MEKTQAIVNGVTITLTQDQLNKINQQQAKKSKEERFLELISDIDISKPMVEFGKYPNRIFWFDSNGNYMFEYDWKNGYVCTNYHRVWSVFAKEYGMRHNHIQGFMKTMVEEHFKLKGTTPWKQFSTTSPLVEEHFKLKGTTPAYPIEHHEVVVEEHFKLNRITLQ